MEVAKATRTALMAGTLVTRFEPLNGFAADRQVHAAARPERPVPRWRRVPISHRDCEKIGFSGATGCFTVFCPEAALRRPALQRFVLCDAREVRVGGEQPKLVTDAELGEDRVDGAHLEAAPARAVAELCGFEVVVTVGTQEGEGTETRHDRLLVARSVETLEELLVDEPRRHDEFASRERPLECADLRHVGWPVAAKRQRPDARVDEEAQLRERSLL